MNLTSGRHNYTYNGTYFSLGFLLAKTKVDFIQFIITCLSISYHFQFTQTEGSRLDER